MINSNKTYDLTPATQKRAIQFIAAAEMELSQKYGKVVKVAITSTFRDNEAQDALYAQGRTEPGKKVTNSPGGDSWHNYRCAFDVAVKVDGVVTWDKEYYKDLGGLAKTCGLVWGGDWDGDGQTDPNDWDLVHFQYTGGLTLAELKTGATIA